MHRRGDMEVLVTGGAGFIDTHIVEVLVKRKIEEVIIDTFETGDQDENEKSMSG